MTGRPISQGMRSCFKTFGVQIEFEFISVGFCVERRERVESVEVRTQNKLGYHEMASTGIEPW